MSNIDLTQLDRPLGEYPDAVIGAILRAKTEGRAEMKTASGGWIAAQNSYYAMSITYRLAPEPLRPMSPPWDVLPEWVQAVARDKDQETWGYEVVPEVGHEVWRTVSGRVIDMTDFRFDRGNMPWNESLVLRPEGV